MDPEVEFLLFLLKFYIFYNASREGWKIKHINSRTYEFSKLIVLSEDVSPESFLDSFLPSENSWSDLLEEVPQTGFKGF